MSRNERKIVRLVVLISGSGTNLQAMIDRIETGELDAEIKAVISDNPQAYGLKRAKAHKIPIGVIDYKKYGKECLPKVPWSELPANFQAIVKEQRLFGTIPIQALRDRLARRVLAERDLIQMIDRYNPDYICLAGFMRLLSPFFVRHYHNNGLEKQMTDQLSERHLTWKIINIHPALLPAFPGVDGYGDTFRYGCKFGGITVHFVDEGEDTGPIIGQVVYPIWPEDDLETIRKRGLTLEYELYSQCINWLARGFVKMKEESYARVMCQINDPNYGEFIQRLVRLAMDI